MPSEKSCGAVIFRQEGKKILYLLLKYKKTSKEEYYYDFPKGHVEKGEEELDTTRREVEEETGIKNVKFIEGFKERIHYFFKWKGETISKDVIFFLAETKTEKVHTSTEHYGFKWLPYEEAMEATSYKNAKEILEKANKFLDSGLRKFM